uniref:RRP15-like protein n=1 Tax=Ornithorhynchus anatinus TaxID=9258 RepID=F6QE19_ORNAN
EVLGHLGSVSEPEGKLSIPRGILSFSSAGSLALGDDLRSSEGDGANDTTGRDEENGDAAESGAGTSTGWAEAMAKILSKKTPQSRPTILVKNKELEQEKKKEKQERLEKRKQLDKKREWEMMCRVKPDVVQDKEKERNLQRIATRGVVQLFNAVRKHQKNVDDKMKEAGGSMRKRAKLMSSVSKKDFISVLRGIEGGKNEESASGKTSQAKVKSEEGPGWNILRDDFMMGASMKDWDKESDKEDSAEPGSDNGQDNESDSDS